MKSTFSNSFLLLLMISSISFVFIAIQTTFLYLLHIRNNLITRILTLREKEFIGFLFNFIISPIYALLISYTIMIAISRGKMSWSWHILGGFYVFSTLFLPLISSFWGRYYSGNWILGLLVYILSIFFHSLAINNFIVKIYSFIFPLTNTWFGWLMLVLTSYLLLSFWYKIIAGVIERAFIRGKNRWICPACGKINKDKYDVCSNCGAEVEKIKAASNS